MHVWCPGIGGGGAWLTELVGLPEAGQRGVETGALFFVGTELLQQLTHLLLTHVQQTFQGHVARIHLLQNTHAHTHGKAAHARLADIQVDAEALPA